MTEKSPASAAHNEIQTLNPMAGGDPGIGVGAQSVQPEVHAVHGAEVHEPAPVEQRSDSQPDGQPQHEESAPTDQAEAVEGAAAAGSPAKASASPVKTDDATRPPLAKASSLVGC